MNLRSRPVLIIAVAILTVIIAAVAIWTLGLNRQSPTPTPPSQSPTPAQATTSGPCRDFETLAYAKHPISCKKAVEFALEQAPGKVQKVSIEPIRAPIPLSTGGIERRTVDMWLIDIQLTTPYNDEESFGDKEIYLLRIGIRTEENNVTYRKPLQ